MYSKISFCILFSLIIGFITKGECKNDTNTVYTESGPILGLYKRTVLLKISYESYRGIPFAEPPITKSHRFKPPIPIKPWTEKLNATADKESCMQKENDEVFGSEDCLYLNVYVPRIHRTRDKKAVIVWIHGGGFANGNGNSSFYGPDFLLEQNVIVVSIQYRLGALGFLNLNHPNATGNAGLKDQVLALRWIRKNIKYFGGDPNQITLMGQSAGGISVDLHKLSDMSVGLFNRTISMSASPLCKYWGFQSNNEAHLQAFSLGKKLGFNTTNTDELLNSFLNANAYDIIKNTDTMLLDMLTLPFRPTLEEPTVAPNEEKFLTECILKKYKEGNYTKGPHLMGFTSTEILSMTKSLQDLMQYYKNAAANVKKSKIFNWLPVVPEFLSWSFKTVADVKKAAFTQVVQELSDIYFGTGIDMKQRLLSKENDAPIYYYKFDFQTEHSAHKSAGLKNLDGVAHEDDVPYFFYRPHLNIPLNDPNIKFQRRILVKLWTHFAKYGNPTPFGEMDSLLEITWPDSRGTGAHLEISDELNVIPDRPTNLLISSYQMFGFKDCSFYNGSDVGLLNVLVESFAHLPSNAQELLISTKNTLNSLADQIFAPINSSTENPVTVVSEDKEDTNFNNEITTAKNLDNQAADAVLSDDPKPVSRTVDKPKLKNGSINESAKIIVNEVSSIISDVVGKIKIPFLSD